MVQLGCPSTIVNGKSHEVKIEYFGKSPDLALALSSAVGPAIVAPDLEARFGMVSINASLESSLTIAWLDWDTDTPPGWVRTRMGATAIIACPACLVSYVICLLDICLSVF